MSGRERRGVDFEEFVTARGQSLLRLAYVLTEDRFAAEDITQSALANTFRRWHAVDQPYPYARRAVVNHAIDRRRRHRSEVLTAPESLEATLDAARIESDDHSKPGLDGLLRQLVRGLPKRQRAVLVLRYFEDLDDLEIADTLGIGQSAVRSTASRALATLRSALADATKRGSHS
jgi:RNA polymerase sigma-70 factor (sigma-E family)